MPILTFTSDIGLQDFIVGAVKGTFLSVNPSFYITDITHFLNRTNYLQAAYICKSAFKSFPKGTVHVVFLNVFEGASTHFLLAEIDQQIIICPDNGLVTLLLNEKPSKLARIPIDSDFNTLQIAERIAKFLNALFQQQGYDIFKSEYAINNIVEKYAPRPTIGDAWIEGQILFIDNFENVVVNITHAVFEEIRKGRSFNISFAKSDQINKLSHNYSDVSEGDYLAWFNSAGYLEIAINKGNIAGLFGLQSFSERVQQLGSGTQNKWFYHTVRIYFHQPS